MKIKASGGIVTDTSTVFESTDSEWLRTVAPVLAAGWSEVRLVGNPITGSDIIYTLADDDEEAESLAAVIARLLEAL